MEPLTPHSVDVVGMFLLGFLGGGHCVGMCGPISLAVCPVAARPRQWLAVLLYNLGRVTTYTAIGGVVGALGGSAADLSQVVRVQLWLTVAAGVLMALFGLGMLRVFGGLQGLFAMDGAKVPGAGYLLGRLVRSQNGLFALPLGLLLGFLPCGLSMAAFTRALSADGWLLGAVLVAAFGVGTLPAMVLVSWLGHRLSLRARRAGEIIAGMILVAMAVQHLSRALPALIG